MNFFGLVAKRRAHDYAVSTKTATLLRVNFDPAVFLMKTYFAYWEPVLTHAILPCDGQ